MKKIIYSILIIFFVGYVCVNLLLFINQNELVFPGISAHPESQEQAKSIGAKPFVWKNPNHHVLNGFSFLGDKDSVLLFYFGGNAANVWDDVPLFRSLNIHSYSLNYPSFGLSEGNPSEEIIIRDALLWTKLVRKQYPKNTKVLLLGRSLGSGVAVQVASAFPEATVVLCTPYHSVLGIAQEQYPWLPISWILKHPFASSSYAKEIENRMYMILAEKDRVVPHVSSQKLFGAWKGNKQQMIIRSSDHINIMSQPDFVRQLTKAIGEYP